MLGIMGKKLGMTRLVDAENGSMIPVTLVEVKPNVVTGFKSEERDGYNALVLGAVPVKKPSKTKKFKKVSEFRVEDTTEFKPEQEVGLDIFEEGATVSIYGYSKGRGFQGVIKRHGFHRGPMSHGSDHHREPGSVGTMKPNRVKPGTKLPGRMGTAKITLKKVKVVKIDTDKQIIALKGPLPGSINGLITITKEA